MIDQGMIDRSSRPSMRNNRVPELAPPRV